MIRSKDPGTNDIDSCVPEFRFRALAWQKLYEGRAIRRYIYLDSYHLYFTALHTMSTQDRSKSRDRGDVINEYDGNADDDAPRGRGQHVERVVTHPSDYEKSMH